MLPDSMKEYLLVWKVNGMDKRLGEGLEHGSFLLVLKGGVIMPYL